MTTIPDLRKPEVALGGIKTNGKRQASRAPHRAPMRGRLARGWDLLALTAYAALALVANYPMWPGDPSRIATCACGGYEDLNQTAWFLAWTPFALFHGHNPFVTNWINFPAGVDLAQNTGMQLLGLLVSPLTLAVSPVASENLLRWLAFPLSAYAMYYVLRRLVAFRPAAFIGGLLYGFSPYMVSQGAVHLNLSFVPLPPLILYLAYELVVRQERRPLRTGLLLGLLAAAQFFISAEVLATTGLIGAIGLFFIVFLCIREVPSHARHALTGLLPAAFVVGAIVAYPLYIMGHATQHYVGPAQGYNQVYNADLLGSIFPTSSQLVAPHRIAKIGSSLVGGLANVDENGSYLGIPLLAMIAYLLVRYWRRLWILFAALMALVALVLSFGPYLYINGKYHRLPVNLPFRKINHLPFLENILPSRFSLYVAFFVAIILAIGIDAFAGDVAARRAGRGPRPIERRVLVGRLVAGGIAIVAAVALIPRWPYQTIQAQPHYAETAAGLAVIPSGSVLLTYPYATPFTDDAMLWQALSGMRFKIFGSYALVRGSRGSATTFPQVLNPNDIEPLLANSLTPIPVPGVPDIPATAATIAATRIVAPRKGLPTPNFGPPTVSGVVVNVDRRAGTFLLSALHSTITQIRTGVATEYIEPWTRHPSLLGVVNGEKVQIYGRVGRGSITPQSIRDLRTFIHLHHVDGVLVELGRRDSALVTAWVRSALGPATRAGGGGELWLSLAQRQFG